MRAGRGAACAAVRGATRVGAAAGAGRHDARARAGRAQAWCAGACMVGGPVLVGRAGVGRALAGLVGRVRARGGGRAPVRGRRGAGGREEAGEVG